MPAHSLAAPGGVRVQILIENSHGHKHPRAMNYGKRVSTRCRCPTSVPVPTCREMLIPQRMLDSSQDDDPIRISQFGSNMLLSLYVVCTIYLLDAVPMRDCIRIPRSSSGGHRVAIQP